MARVGRSNKPGEQQRAGSSGGAGPTFHMELSFLRERVERLLEHTCNGPRSQWRVLADHKPVQEPGLWLLIDNGIYLCTNVVPVLLEAHEIDAEADEYRAYALGHQKGLRDCSESVSPSPEGTVHFLSADRVRHWIEGSLGSWLIMHLSGSVILRQRKSAFLPDSLKKSMGERSYDLALQAAGNLKATLSGRSVFANELTRDELIEMIGAYYALRTKNPHVSFDRESHRKLGSTLSFNSIPVPELSLPDLNVMLVVLLEPRESWDIKPNK